MTDSELRELMRESAANGRRALFDEYCAYVYAIAALKLKGCGSREDIEECVSDVFAEVYRVCCTDNGYDGDLKGIIGVIARRTATDFFRRLSSRSGRTVPMDDTAGELRSSEDVAANAERSEISRILRGCIADLGEPDTTIITQHYYYGRTVREIAAALKMTDSAVQKRSTRARAKLRELLAEKGVEEI
ncbi:MAG: sigma-70 family RNA polymerase sigma factor [Ruminococcus sp.]|nr:sigma-70 family RNA polymerase sigma factor [Ruminococcus sp.]